MKKVVKTEVFGYLKIGVNRELKKVLESFWSGSIGRDDFLRETEEINFARLKR
jgi:5-methyltetrahydropteroyltriglutamate--homocysteine methyltransferase